MEMHNSLSKVLKCDTVDLVNDYVLFTGQQFYSYAVSTQVLSEYPAIRPCPHKWIVLPGDLVLVEGGGDEMYHLLSLEQGTRLASIKIPKSRFLGSSHFIYSPEENLVYDFWSRREKTYLVQISLFPLQWKAVPVQLTLRGLRDIAYTPENNISVLLTQTDSDENGARVTNQIATIRIKSDRCELDIRHEWVCAPSCRPVCFDGISVLQHDVSVRNIATGTIASLLENSSIPFTQELGFLSYRYYSDLGILQLSDGRQEDFIDCKSRSIVARYNTNKETFRGCLIDGKYWFATKGGILQKDFPLIENVPPRKLKDWLGR